MSALIIFLGFLSIGLLVANTVLLFFVPGHTAINLFGAVTNILSLVIITDMAARE